MVEKDLARVCREIRDNDDPVLTQNSNDVPEGVYVIARALVSDWKEYPGWKSTEKTPAGDGWSNE